MKRLLIDLCLLNLWLISTLSTQIITIVFFIIGYTIIALICFLSRSYAETQFYIYWARTHGEIDEKPLKIIDKSRIYSSFRSIPRIVLNILENMLWKGRPFNWKLDIKKLKIVLTFSYILFASSSPRVTEIEVNCSRFLEIKMIWNYVNSPITSSYYRESVKLWVK